MPAGYGENLGNYAELNSLKFTRTVWFDIIFLKLGQTTRRSLFVAR